MGGSSLMVDLGCDLSMSLARFNGLSSLLVVGSDLLMLS